MNLIHVLKNSKVQGEIILIPGRADTSKSCLAILHYVTNVYTNFQSNHSKTVGGVCDTKLLVSCTQTTHGHTVTPTDKQTDEQDDSSLPQKHWFCGGI